MRFLVFLLLAASLQAATITGRVVGIADGDTLTVLTAKKESVKVRLYGIDAPESKQAFGQRARQELSALVFGREVAVEVKEKDRYGRSIGRVTVGELAVNAEMVRRGFAWWYRDFAKKDAELQQAEADARKAKRGLWVDPAPVPPWEFRRTESGRKKTTAAG